MATTAHPSVDSLSPLERLPKELAWQVIDYAPECALQIRSVSQQLQRNVDEYACAHTTVLVEKLSFADVRLPGSKKPPGYLGVIFNMDKSRSDLFYLRLHLLGLQDFKVEIKKMQNIVDEEPMFYNRNFFCLDFDTQQADVQEKFDTLQKWLGRRIGKVMFNCCEGESQLAAASKTLEGITVRQMKLVCATQMTDEIYNHLLKEVLQHKVDHLSISVANFNATTDPLDILRTLSAHVSSLHLYQLPLIGSDVVANKHLFGTNEVEWADIILELYTGKLNKLSISNPTYPEYLSSKSADRLKTDLPAMDKNVWLAITCNKYDKITDMVRDCEIKVNPAPPVPANANQNAPVAAKQHLQIKHKSRVNEPAFEPLFQQELVETK